MIVGTGTIVDHASAGFRKGIQRDGRQEVVVFGTVRLEPPRKGCSGRSDADPGDDGTSSNHGHATGDVGRAPTEGGEVPHGGTRAGGKLLREVGCGIVYYAPRNFRRGGAEALGKGR